MPNGFVTPFVPGIYTSPNTIPITDLIARQGADAAAARERQGQITGDAFNSIGQTIANLPVRIAQAKAAGQEAQQRQMEIAAATANQQGLTHANQIVSSLMTTNADGSRTVDRTKAQQAMASANVPLPVQQSVFKALDDTDASIQKFTAAKTDHRADLAHSAITMIDAGLDPHVAVATAAQLAHGNGLTSDAEIGQFMDGLSTVDPTQIRSVLAGVRANSEKYKDVEKPVVIPEGGTLSTPAGKTIATGAPKAKTTAELAADAADPQSPTAAQSRAALAALHPAPAPTEAGLDAAFQALDAKKRLGQPLTKEEQANYDAYNARKNDPAAARQDKTIQAQIDTQKRAQDFTELQAGRTDLDKNVTTPFLTAQNSANTLRDVVEAAKNGNKVAASLQSLETTMSAIRAQGLNRINSTEVGATANAGSMYDRISGWLGKATAGEPVPADIQKDMLAFSDILEKAAYRKYKSGYDSTVKLYPTLSKVSPLADPFAGQSGAPAPAGTAPQAPVGWKYVPKPGGGWTAVEDK